jgi:hypothetical protein
MEKNIIGVHFLLEFLSVPAGTGDTDILEE